MARWSNYLWLAGLIWVGGCHLLLPGTTPGGTDAATDGPRDTSVIPPDMIDTPDAMNDAAMVDDAFVCPVTDLGPVEAGPPLGCSESLAWCWDQPDHSQANNLNDVWFGLVAHPGGGAEETTIAVGDHGVVLSKKGAAWATPEIIDSRNLRGVAVASDSNGDVLVVAVGDGVIWERDGNGWHGKIFNAKFEDVYIGSTYIYAAGRELQSFPGGPTVYRRSVTDAVGSFVPMAPTASGSGTLKAIHGDGSSVVTVGKSDSNLSLAHSLTNGTWSPITGLHGQSKLDFETVWVGRVNSIPVTFVGGRDDDLSQAKIWRSGGGLPDASAALSCASAAACSVKAVSGVVPSALFAVTDRASASQFDGTLITLSVAPLTPPPSDLLASAWARSSTNLMAVGQGGRVRRFDGTQWVVEQRSEFGAVWGGHSVAVSGVEDTLAVAHNWLYRRTGAGPWRADAAQANGTSGWISGRCDAWSGGQVGLMRFEDGWGIPALGAPEQLSLPPSSSGLVASGMVLGIWGEASDAVWAVGLNGIWFWNGSLWSLMVDLRQIPCTDAPTMHRNALDVWGGLGEALVVGGCNGLGNGGFIYRCNSAGCSEVAGGLNEGFLGVWGINQQYIAVGTNGLAVTHQTIDATGLSAGGATQLMPGHGTMLTAVTGKGSLSDVYAVTETGYLARFNGTSWTSEPTIAAQRLLSIWITPGGKLYAGGDFGALISLNVGP